MKCSSCGGKLEQTDNFRCRNCGTGHRVCTACGTPNQAGFRFCHQCGAKFSSGSQRAAPPDGPLEPFLSERRQLTVLFSDLVGSTALSTKLDPEDLAEVISLYQSCVAGTVHEFDGHVARYLGDGALIFFGYPKAHENEAERAIRTGLALITSVSSLPFSEPLQTRIGIATGLVVVRDLINAAHLYEQDIVGETPNLAARLQAHARPNTVLIDAATHRLAGKLFDYQSLGPVDVKGFDRPLPVWQVDGPSLIESRFEALRSESAAFIGRQAEVQVLRSSWQNAVSGRGQVLLVVGEAGIGKSRLVSVFLSLEELGAPTRLRYFCSEQHTNSPLYPVIRQIERAAGLSPTDAPVLALDKMESLLAPSSAAPEELSVLADLLSIDVPHGRYPELDLTPQRRRQLIFDALTRQVRMLADNGPLVLLFEDAHWVDPSSYELLERVIDLIRDLPVFAIITFRPEFQPQWPRREHVSTLEIGRLANQESEALARQVATGTVMSDATLIEIVERSDGNPLFIEELTRAVVEAGDTVPKVLASAPQRRHGESIPATLHASLVSRLDRLGPAAKETAQLGAAIGRQFSFNLLAEVARMDRSQLIHALSTLDRAGLVTSKGPLPDTIYTFKHALLQDAAYTTLLRSRRRELHAAIVRELAERYSGTSSAPALLAHHYTEAGLIPEAIRAWRSAARQSVAQGSFAEADIQLRTGLGLLQSLAQSSARDRHEVALQNAHGNVLIALKGYTAPETLAALHRARALAAELADPGQALRALWGLGSALLFAGKLGEVLEMIKEAAPLVDLNGHLDARLALSEVHGGVMLQLGLVQQAKNQLDATLAMDVEPSRDRERAILYGQSPRISTLGTLSLTMWLLGRSAVAWEISRSCVEEAQALAHKPMMCLAHSTACRLSWLAGQSGPLTLHASELQRLAADQGTPLWLALAKTYRGWSEVANDRMTDGVRLMEEGLAEYIVTGAHSATPLLRLALGRACTLSGRFSAAAGHLSEALKGGVAGEEHWLDAEVLGELGTVHLHCGDEVAAEAAFRRALEIAKQQNALAFEARASTRLSRFLISQSRYEEASEVLLSAQQSARKLDTCEEEFLALAGLLQQVATHRVAPQATPRSA